MNSAPESSRDSRYWPRTFFDVKLRPWGLLTAAGSLLCCASVTGFLGRRLWVFDLTSHFRVQYFLLLSGATLFMLLGRKRRLACVFAGFAVVNLLTIAPLYFGRGDSSAAGMNIFRVMLLNVNTANRNFASVKELIRSQNPDVLVLEEINSIWLEQLHDLDQSHPYAEVHPRSDNFGIGLFSRHPLIRSEIVEIGEAGLPSVVAEMDVSGISLTVLGTHPLPPGGPEYARLRNEQLGALPGVLDRITTPVVLMGDLNVTPWSWHFRTLLRRTGLQDSTQGRGVQPTWPSHNLLFRIPIDHVLHSPGLRVVSRKVGPDIGSDHFPVIVDLAVPIASQPRPKAERPVHTTGSQRGV